ncbi:hypothetical protein AAG565_07970 [Fontimonas sp. SYSU GA230001]|uniref:hypothetical protein n=1 Tax=Fontimonas sp. SYSU GA230001 TaxID=3142450 RepID=UPI0032B59314
MDEKRAAPKDWLEPPDWWKKWRPLRWLAGGLVLVALYLWFGPEPQPEPRETVRATPVPTAVAVIEPSAAPTPASTPVPSAAPVTAAPSAVPTPDRAAEAMVYEEAPGAQPQVDSDLAAFTRIEPDPVPLLGRYRSFMGVDEVVVGLEQAGFKPMVESRHAKVRAGLPPRNFDVVTVHQFQHWGQQGRLELQFFNNRLYQTEFEPDDADLYRAAQRRELPQLKREASGRSELIQGNLRIASSLDLAVSEVGRSLRTRPFLLWQDRRLVRQRDEWDRRFSESARR